MKLIPFDKKFYEKKVKTLPFNRQFHVSEALQENMNNFGFCVPIVLILTELITGVKELFVADGQHRGATASFLNIPFYGVVIDYKFTSIEEIVEFVSSLNSSQKRWKLKDYCIAFASLNNEDYKYLLKRKAETGYTLGTLAILFNGSIARRSGSVTAKICTGKFKVNALDKAEDILAYSAELSNYKKFSSRMLLGLANVILTSKNFDKVKFKKKFKANIDSIKELKLDDYTDIFKFWNK